MDTVAMIQGLRNHPAGDILVRGTVQFQSRVKAAKKISGEEKSLQLQQAAREFEAIFVSYLLKVMRETMEESGLTGEGMGKTVYAELFDQELARSISSNGSFGIADLLVRRITAQEKMSRDEGTMEPGPVTPARSPPSVRGGGKSEVPDFRMPIQATVSSEFGMREDPFTRKSRFHRGIDIAAPKGTPGQAALGGEVLFSGYANGYGNTVVVEHAGGYQTRYAHLGSLAVTKGEVLETEQVLGSVGSTGRSTGPHLHFEVSRYGKRINPRTALAE